MAAAQRNAFVEQEAEGRKVETKAGGQRSEREMKAKGGAGGGGGAALWSGRLSSGGGGHQAGHGGRGHRAERGAGG